jgi:hypothetical protein
LKKGKADRRKERKEEEGECVRKRKSERREVGRGKRKEGTRH